MDRLMWASIFATTLAEWHPGVSIWTLQALGEHCYSPTDEDPEGAARAYAERVKQPPIDTPESTDRNANVPTDFAP